MNTRSMNKPVRWLFTICLILSMMLSVAGPARAASFVVTNLNDSGPGSLRQAISDANTTAGPDTITFNLSGTILLASTLPAISDAAGLTIDGAGQSITISGNQAVRVMFVNAGAVLTLRNLTVADGNANSSPVFPTWGGGIYNFGTLRLINSTFLKNNAGLGGGIFNDNGTLEVSNSTFSENNAYDGGGIYSNYGTLDVSHSTFSENSAFASGGGIEGGITVNVTDSTFSGNTAGAAGGGILGCGTCIVTNSTFSGNSAGYEGGGGIANSGTLEVTNSTFSNNTASGNYLGGGGIYNSGTLSVINSTFSENSSHLGGGIYTIYGSAILKNTIVANSTGGNCFRNNSLVDGGGNLSWPDATCPGLNDDPLLGPLQDNGGPTQTHALLAGSQAIDVALLSNCPATDQRGVSRPQGARCDIGAFELEGGAVGPTITINTPPDGAIYVLGQVVNADYACQEQAGGSGLAYCVGPVPSGSPIDTGSIGAKSFRVNAADNAGILVWLTHHYSVVDNFNGFYQPVDNLPTWNVVRAGAGIPVRFSLSGDHGLNIFAAGYPVSKQLPCGSGLPQDKIEQTVAAGSSSLSYDAASDTYTYVWPTNSAWAGTCRQFIIRLNNGREHRANFKFVR